VQTGGCNDPTSISPYWRIGLGDELLSFVRKMTRLGSARWQWNMEPNDFGDQVPAVNTPSDSANSNGPSPLKITGDSKPTVPAFSCTVYVSKTADGTIRARVANLAGDDSGEICATGNSERDALLKVTRQFKSRVAKMHGENQEIPWTDPPTPPLENEQVRFVPIHL